MRALLIACLSLTLAAAPATAAVMNFVATLDEAPANAGLGTGSAGTGTATLSYDSGTGMLTWNISWSGLTGPAFAAHIHGPAPAGVNAGVQVDFFSLGGGVNPSVGSTAITPSQAADLMAELWYINVHTSQFGSGEIRGQILNAVVSNDETSVSRLKGNFEQR